MSIVGSVVQGSGGVSDLKDTVEKFSIAFADSPYTIATTASCLISVDTANGAVVILPPASLTNNQIVQIEDDGLNAATNIITFQATVDGAADPTIESDGGGMTVEYNGTRWRTRDTDDNLLKYHADLNEIQARGDAALVASSIKTSSGLVVIGADGSISAVNGVIGLAGTPTEKTVADGTNIGANVDQNGVLDFGNEPTYANLGSNGTTVVNTSSGITNPNNSIDGSTSADCYSSASSCTIVYDLGVGYSGTYTKIGILTGSFGGNGSHPRNIRISTSSDGISFGAWEDVAADIPLPSSGNPEVQYDFQTPRTDRYVRYEFSVKVDAFMYMPEVYTYDKSYPTSDNTTDLAITTGAVTTDPSSLVIYDENDDPITGTGKMNVGYEVDGGGFSIPVDQETFKALGGIESTTDFSIRPQAVGAQRWSRATISTISTVFRASASGTIFEVDSVSVFEVTATGVISSKQFYAETVALTAGASVATNCQLSNKFSLTPDQDFTLANPTNLKAGAEYTWIITNDATPRTITFDTAFLFAGGSAPSLTASAGAIDIFRGECDGTDILITQAILDLS
jgi:hypothetical protein